MFGAKAKKIGGRKYMVIGGSISRKGTEVVEKLYATTVGTVRIKNGVVYHPNGDETPE